MTTEIQQTAFLPIKITLISLDLMLNRETIYKDINSSDMIWLYILLCGGFVMKSFCVNMSVKWLLRFMALSITLWNQDDDFLNDVHNMINILLIWTWHELMICLWGLFFVSSIKKKPFHTPLQFLSGVQLLCCAIECWCFSGDGASFKVMSTS